MSYGGKNGDTMAFLQSEAARSAPQSAPQAPAPAAPQPSPAPAPDAKLALAMSMQQQVEAPQPYEAAAPSPAAPASVPHLDVTAATMAASGLTIPLPPSRPTELADAGPDMPMPPVRPSELKTPIEPPAPTAQQAARLNRADGISSLLASRAALPAVITQGTGRGAHAAPPPAVLAYAGSPAEVVPGAARALVPVPVPRPVDLVSARLDRSNFRSLTSGAKAEKAVPRSPMGSSVVGIRAAARASSSSFASASATSSFGSRASDLSTDKFSGPAIKPEAKLVTAKRAE